MRDVDVRTAEKPPTRSTEALIREIYLQRLARAVPEDIVCRPRLDGVLFGQPNLMVCMSTVFVSVAAETTLRKYPYFLLTTF